MDNEARMAFWSLAYLVVLHREIPNVAREHADIALDHFDEAAAEVLGSEPIASAKEHS